MYWKKFIKNVRLEEIEYKVRIREKERKLMREAKKQLRKETIKEAIQRNLSYNKALELAKNRKVKFMRKEEYLTLKKIIRGEELTAKQKNIEEKVRKKYEDIIKELTGEWNIEHSFYVIINGEYKKEEDDFEEEFEIEGKIRFDTLYQKEHSYIVSRIYDGVIVCVSKVIKEMFNEGLMKKMKVQIGIEDIEQTETDRQVNKYEIEDWEIEEAILRVFNGYDWYDYSENFKEKLENCIAKIIEMLEKAKEG